MATNRIPSLIEIIKKQKKNEEEIKHLDKIERGFAFNLNVTTTTIDKEINEIINKLDTYITQLREQDFNYSITIDNQKVLIKNLAKIKDSQLDPIARNEAEVQALRYVRGMLLIAKHSPDKIKNILLSRISNIYKEYQEKKMSADSTAWLADQFANCIAENLLEVNKATTSKKKIYKKAREQLAMARDLSLMMEKRPIVCTISTNNENNENKETIEISEPFKIQKKYYNDKDKLFKNIDQQPWIVNANKKAGLNKASPDNWLNTFFKGDDFETIKEFGSVAPPSARWLPIPANNQLVSIDVAKEDDPGSTNDIDQNEIHETQTDFIRMGVAIPFDIRNIENMDETQKKIAKKILLEVINNQIDNKFEVYKNIYGNLADKLPFYLNYQTLLSPLIGEIYLPYKDNNAKFIKFIKEIFNDNDLNMLKTNFSNNNGVELIITHTNSAINRNAKYSNEMPEDNMTRRKKINEFNNIKKNLGLEANNKIHESKKELTKKYGWKLFNELIIREKACDCLQNLLDGKSPYHTLETYQRNIMMAGLEHLAMGKQSLTLAGCKSARDRTGVFACTIKTMLDNPETMKDWKKLEAGIVKSLKQGHAFRSMIFHSAIVKVSLVHKKFMKELNENTQKNIDELLIFSKRLGSYKKNKSNKETTMQPENSIKDSEDKLISLEDLTYDKEKSETNSEDGTEDPELIINNSKTDNQEEPLLAKIDLMMHDLPDNLIDTNISNKDLSHDKKNESFSKHNTIKSFSFFNKQDKEISLEKIESEMKQHQAIINTLTSKNYFNKMEAEQLVGCIKKCKKLHDNLNMLNYNLIQSTKFKNLSSDLDKIINATVQVATYENTTLGDSCKKLGSSYHRGDQELKIEQIIAKNSEGKIISKLLCTDNLKKLGKESGNYGSKIMLLNEAIKWIEEALHAANAKEPISLTLEHHQSLDRKFLLNMVAYCKIKNYHLELNGTNKKFSAKKIKGIIKLYNENEQILYKIDSKSKEAPLSSRLPTLTAHY